MRKIVFLINLFVILACITIFFVLTSEDWTMVIILPLPLVFIVLWVFRWSGKFLLKYENNNMNMSKVNEKGETKKEIDLLLSMTIILSLPVIMVFLVVLYEYWTNN